MITRRSLMGGAALLALMTVAAHATPDEALAKLVDSVLSKGPNGEDPAPASAVSLTDDEVAQIKAMKATAAIVMHIGGNDWSNAQINGLQTQFAAMGIEVIAVTDAGFKPEKQVSDIETIMAQKPSIIVSIPTDPSATASAYKAAADAGVKIVFMDNVAAGMTAGKDYVSVVSADNYGNGVASAHLMAKVQRQDLDLALVTLDSRPALTRAAAEVPLSWVGAAQGGTVRLAAYPEGCVFRRAMIASLQAAGRPWQVAVQSSSHAGIFAAVRAGVAVSAVATGTAPPDLGEGGAGLPALPRIPVYLVSTAKLRPLARRLEAALMTQMLAWPNR